jgi:hypothetical protein
MLDLQSDVNSRMKPGSQFDDTALFARTTEKAIKLALIAAVSDRADEIDVTHAAWATRRALASDEALVRAAEHNIAENDHGRLCNDIFRTVLRFMPDGIAEGKLASYCRTFKDGTPRARRDALQTLIEDGRVAKRTHVGGNGRSSERLIATKVLTEPLVTS